MASFAGKTVLVTGASSGIGRATAKAFAVEGATVLAVARSRERLNELAGDPEASGRIVPLVADVADGPSMETLAREVLSRQGVPDVVVANAGIGNDSPFVETTDETWKVIFDVNVFGVVRTIRPFLPAMIERGRGRVILVSSVVGKRGVPNYAAYSASKFALHGMADAIRPEILGTGVTLGIVCPSSTDSEFDARKVRAGTPQKRVRVQLHSAEKVAKAIVRMSRWTRREMVLSPEGKLMSIVSWLAPGFMDRVLARALVKKSETGD